MTTEYTDLHTKVYEALGAASVAWTNEGIFMSEFAKKIGDELIEYITTNYTKN